MKGYIANIETATVENEDFRRVLYTGHNAQLVLMSIPAGREIGQEVHQLDQFLRVEVGEGKAIMDGAETVISAGFAILVPAGAQHNVVNTGSEPMKLYTVYAPPAHQDGVVRATKEEAETQEEHFDGTTTE
jgi:mannose-6-phosphate isomerase-like protein (cupin superfamily)